MTVLLFKNEPRPEVPDVDEDLSQRARGPRIRCPRCEWEPQSHDRWMCTCLHVWNTFDTGGRCPSCGHEWQDTQCLRCHEWSPHKDWYVDGLAGERS
jgi:hypothetical protein